MKPAEDLRETAGNTHTYTAYRRVRPLAAAPLAIFNIGTPWDLEIVHSSRCRDGLHKRAGRGSATRATRENGCPSGDNSTGHHVMNYAKVGVRPVRGVSYPGLTR